MKSALLFLAAIFPGQSYAIETLKYEPAIVTLQGTLTLDAFPGPPEYASIADGDEVQQYWILNLDNPVKVVIDPGEELFVTHDNVRKIQLVCPQGCRKLLHPRAGQKVSLVGTLYSAHTAQHHTSVLMTVQKKEN